MYISMSIHSATVNGHCAAPSMRGWHAVRRGTRCAAAIQVGKSALKLPYCCKLGLGVLDISITVGMGADVITSSAGCCTRRCRSATRRTAQHIHVGKSPSLCKLGLGVREIMVGAGTGTDVMASRAWLWHWVG
jgi:hypothetical protein